MQMREPLRHRTGRALTACAAAIALTTGTTPTARAVVPAQADLEVRAVLGAPWIRVGTSVEATVRVTNRGPGRATHVLVSPELGAGLSLDGLLGRGDCTLVGPVCDLGALDPGETELVTLRLGGDEEGTHEADVAVSGDALDPDLLDNVAGLVLAAGPEGSRCTMRGTPRRDRLRGTPGDDVICALGGADVVRGRGGADRLLGGRGKDRLLGGRRGDHLQGGRQADRLRGGQGRDRLVGGAGRDDVVGGRGRDRCPGRERARSC